MDIQKEHWDTTRLRAAARAFMPAVGLTLLFVAASLFDPWGRVHPLLHGALFGILAGIILGCTMFAFRVLRRGGAVDPVKWGRYGLILPILAVGVYLAVGDMERRLVIGFKPSILFAPPDMTINGEVRPPAYTRLETLPLNPNSGNPVSGDDAAATKPLTVPEGARIILRATDTRWPPVLRWDGADEPLRPQEDGSFEIAGEIKADSRLTLTFGGHVLARWDLKVTPDAAPRVNLVAPIEATPRKSLRISFEAEDDHGVAYLALQVTPEGKPDAVPVLVDMPAYDTKRIEEVQFLDLTSHAHAGEDVVVRLVAVDGLGQEGLSEPFHVALPKRRFTSATAMSVIGARTALMADEPSMDTAIRRLGGLTESDVFPSDTTVHLGLRIAYRRLQNNPNEATIRQMADLLWDLALSAEDGGLSVSEVALHDALMTTMTLIKKGASSSVVEASVQNFALSFEEYGKARSSRRYINPAARIAEENDLRASLDWVALRRFFSRLLNLVEDEAMGEALNRLEILQEGLEQRPDLMLSAAAYRRYLVASYARRMVDELTREQRVLMSRSMLPSSMTGSGINPDNLRRGLAGNQRAIRDALSDMIRHLDQAGLPELDAFHRAKSAMDEAVRLLEGSDSRGSEQDRSTSAQVQILTALDLALRTLNNVPSPLMVGDDGRVHDPLGRPLPPSDTLIDAAPEMDELIRAIRP